MKKLPLSMAFPKEREVQSAIVEYLELVGRCIVLQTFLGHAAGMARASRQAGARVGTLSTPGVPDLLVTKRTWPAGTLLGMEVKAARGSLTPEQKILADAGRIIIVRSIEDAEAALKAFEEALRAH